MTDPVADAVGFGIQELRDAANQLDLTWRLRPGTVQAPSIGGDLILVVVDGDDTPVPAASPVGAAPSGARVMVMSVPPAGTYIVGFVDRMVGSNENGFNGNPGTGTTTSASYADIPGAPTTSLVKVYGPTRLRVSLHVTFFVTVAQAGTMFGVNIGGTDYDVASYEDTVPGLGVRLSRSGVAYIAGIPAGAVSVVGRWRRTSGSGTVNMFGPDDWLSLAVAEVN